LIFFDTESIGLIGPCVLIQYAEDDGPVKLHHVFKESIKDTLSLIKRLCNDTICGFNLTHDWFHINKLYNVLSLVSHRFKPPAYLEFIDVHKRSHKQLTRFCLKPKKALDLFLHARKGPWQSLMDRKDIVIKKVPIDIAHNLADVLMNRIQLPWIYFARGTQGYQWKVEIIEDDPAFANIALRFKPSSALKALASEIFKSQQLEFPMPKWMFPKEDLSNPYETEPWSSLLETHVDYWYTNKQAKSYAENDVILLQKLYLNFGEPEADDDDSVLACCVGACRWRGFALDFDLLRIELHRLHGIYTKPKVNINAPRESLRYLKEVASQTEELCLTNTTKETLEAIKDWGDSKLSSRCKEILNARSAKISFDLLSKLLFCGRFCPDFKIIGTLSGRMSGGGQRGKGSINPQGIPKTNSIREIFTLAGSTDLTNQSNDCLSGGDFDSFEVTIADAAYNDPTLRADLLSGKSFHAMFGTALFDIPYDEILSSKGTTSDDYARSKTGTFGLFYGQTPEGLGRRLGISKDQSNTAYEDFISRYPGIDTNRKIIFDAFCSMRQPGGIGTPIIWRDPNEYIQSLLGFKRYFTLENSIVRSLFKLAEDPPKKLEAQGSVIRRGDKTQTPRGAMRSALFGCAFQIQARNMRAAANHVIQSTGAEITKGVQRAIWDLQLPGIHPWCIQPLNMHDEIMVVHSPDLEKTIEKVVQRKVQEYTKVVPLLKMEWKTGLKSWAEK